MFTAPTALRAIRAVDPDASSLDGIDISSLRAMFVAGERADPNTINFFEEKLKIPVVSARAGPFRRSAALPT
jgi:propionyl-CoA synthetase